MKAVQKKISFAQYIEGVLVHFMEWTGCAPPISWNVQLPQEECVSVFKKVKHVPQNANVIAQNKRG